MINNLVENILILYVFIAAGFLLGKVLKERAEAFRKKFTRFMINVVSPIQILITMTTNSFSIGIIFISQLVLIMLALFSINSITVLKFLKDKEWVSDPQRGTHFLNVAFPNVLFFTIPLILAFFKEELIVVSVFYAVIALIVRGSAGILICERFGRGKKENQTIYTLLKDILKALFTFPPFLSIIISTLLITTRYHQSISDYLLPLKTFVNSFASYSSLVLVGMVLAGLVVSEVKTYWKHIRITLIWRVIVSFCVYLSIVYFLDFGVYDSQIKRILLIIVCGPPAVFNVIFSVYFDLDEKFAAISVAFITLVVLLLIPLYLYIGLLLFPD